MSAESINLRRGTVADADELASFGAHAFASAFGPDNTPENMAQYLEGAFSASFIKSQLADPACLFLLAEIGDHLVGYAMLRQGPVPEPADGENPVELVRIYADPSRIGTGIGSALMSAAIQAAAAGGHRTVWLGVWEHNQRAIAFYRRWGFVKVGEKTFVLGTDPQTDHVMVRRV